MLFRYIPETDLVTESLSRNSTFEPLADEANTFEPRTVYPGFALFTQNLFIIGASMIYKFGRSEDLWT